MKLKLYFTLILAAALCFYGCTKTVYIIEVPNSSDNPVLPELEDVDDVCTKMTDAHFKEYCYENFDADNDGKVSMKEAELVTEIDCSTAEDFAGIEYFTNLESFKSYSAKHLDLSYNIQLSYICLSSSCRVSEVAVSLGPGAPVETLDLSHNVNLTELPEFAFCYCENLLSVTLPENLTTIWSYAFDGCTSLASVSLPENLTTIESSAFVICTSLASISFPENLTTIGSYAFEKCTALASASLPENLTTIGSYAFFGCTSLASVSLPENLTTIELFAFFECTSLSSVSLPENLTTIGNSAFHSTFLTSVTSNATTPPTVVGSSAFSNILTSTLYVPSGSEDAYEDSDWTKWFDNFLPIE